MAVQQKTQQNQGPNLKALGLKSPMEVIDILALLNIDGERVIKDDRSLLDPNQKAKAIMEYFASRFKVKPTDLPYLASMIKQDLKNGKIGWRKR
jgi:hypothetical protein